MKNVRNKSGRSFSRRQLLRGGGLLTASLLHERAGDSASNPGAWADYGPDVYKSIGVRPFINCQGDKTILSGSLILPEVRQAMEEASRYFVHLDELMETVGARLAELTGAEWGIVTAGCAAAITHATAACIAGGDPEKLQRLPNLEGLKNEVVVPKYCRNVYDHAVRMLGVKMVEVEDLEQLQAALSPRTAMIYVFFPRGSFNLEVISSTAQPKGVPVFVDAAAEDLTIPNVHLQRGATLVGYSGGKILRGPQCAGLLLGRRDLVQAAFLNSAPHHSFGRSMKAGKEEIVGMLAAVEAWLKRDHEAERRQWLAWLEHISSRVGKVPGVTAEVLYPEEPSKRPVLRIRWDGGQLGIVGEEVEKGLEEGKPRIVIPPATGDRRGQLASSITIVPMMMSPGEENSVAERLYTLLAEPPSISAPPRSDKPAQIVAGQWDVHLEFVSGRADHRFVFEQEGNELRGTHRAQFLTGDLRGTIEGDAVRFLSSQAIEGTWLHYEFVGKVEGDTMQGTVGLEEYGQARWTARRHQYTKPGGEPFLRPVKGQ